METKITIPALQQMKRDGKKIAGVVAWDYPMARIADRAGVDIVSVGDSVGVNLWGHANPLEVTMEEMLVVCQGGAPRRQPRAGELRLSVRPAAGGHATARCGPPSGSSRRRAPT